MTVSRTSAADYGAAAMLGEPDATFTEHYLTFEIEFINPRNLLTIKQSTLTGTLTRLVEISIIFF